jgi:hypothetical protein
MNNFEGINSGHFLELMDRIHICSMNIQDHILDHPLVEQNPNSEVGIHLNNVMEHLFNAYQSVAKLENEYNVE